MPHVSVTDLDDPDKARLIFRSDIKDDVAGIINQYLDPIMNVYVPVQEIPSVMESGSSGSVDNGIEYSFNVTDDKFASGNPTLVNHKTYHYMSISYGFVVWKDYGLPSWWGPDWLIIATSYSGNTEETLDGVSQALENGGTVLGITSGGKLEEILSINDECVCLEVPGGQMPRSAFGHIFGTQLAACWALGILEKPDEKKREITILLFWESLLLKVRLELLLTTDGLY